MNKTKTNTLLPSGMADVLHPGANNMHVITNTLFQTMKSWGYQVVNPPLMEFETSLFSNAGKYWKNQAFRLADPLSQNSNQSINGDLKNSYTQSSCDGTSNDSIAIRCDMTTQVARIACDRLGHRQRPLRLCYNGKVFRTFSRNAENLRERNQIGAELYSQPSFEADFEALALAIDCLKVINVPDPHISISYPFLMKSWITSFTSDNAILDELSRAINWQHNKLLLKIKDSASSALQECIDGLLEWIDVTADNRKFEDRLESYQKTKIGKKYKEILHKLSLLLFEAKTLHSVVTWHIDLADMQGFDYQDGFCFSLFSVKSKTELGRGGRYTWQNQNAVGFSFYIESLELITAIKSPIYLYLPYDCKKVAKELRQQGYNVVVALCPEKADKLIIAKQLNCSFIWNKHLGLIEINKANNQGEQPRLIKKEK